MARVIDIMPELEGEELQYIQMILEPLSEEEAKKFVQVYRIRRKNPQDILIFSIIGLLVVPGLQRFILNQIGMGLLYLFTIGLCFVGSILDLVNHKKLCFEYNQRIAEEARFALGI